jgi:hypothetical protein
VNHDNAAWASLQDHVSGPSLAPGTPNGASFWEKVLDGGVTPLRTTATVPVFSLTRNVDGTINETLPLDTILTVTQGQTNVTSGAVFQIVEERFCDVTPVGLSAFRLNSVAAGVTGASFTINVASAGLQDRITVAVVIANDGAKGADGVSPLQITTPLVRIPCAADGTPIGSGPWTGAVTVHAGSIDVSSQATVQITGTTGVLGQDVGVAAQTVAIYNPQADGGFVRLNVTVGDITTAHTLDFQKQRPGEDGIDGPNVIVDPPATVLHLDEEGNVMGAPQRVRLRAYRDGLSKPITGVSSVIHGGGYATAAADGTDIVVSASGPPGGPVTANVAFDGISQQIGFKVEVVFDGVSGGEDKVSAFIDTCDTNSIFSEVARVSLTTGPTGKVFVNLVHVYASTTGSAFSQNAKVQYSLAGANSWNDFDIGPGSDDFATGLLAYSDGTAGFVEGSGAANLTADTRYDFRAELAEGSGSVGGYTARGRMMVRRND